MYNRSLEVFWKYFSTVQLVDMEANRGGQKENYQTKYKNKQKIRRRALV